MKTIAKNDILEVLKVDEAPKAQLMHNELQAIDQRCKWTMGLIQAWGMAVAMGDMMEDRKRDPIPPDQLVMRVCEVVDAAWNEMRHRGWIIDVGSLGD